MQEYSTRSVHFYFKEGNFVDPSLKPTHLLETTLAKLNYLDLSGKVIYNPSAVPIHGGFSDVFIGFHVLPSGDEIKVAVKRLRLHTEASQDEFRVAKWLAEEISIWSELEHRNILPLLGFVQEGSYPCLVSEWMENGTLARYVMTHLDCDIVNKLTGIARALEYLHNMNIVHSDIKAQNVLVSKAGEPRLCDFGVSRRLTSTHTIARISTNVKGSLRWMSPELLDIKENEAAPTHTKASDVWAFGMLVQELLTRKIPYDHLKLDAQVLMAIVHHRLPQRPIGPWPLQLDRVWTLCQPVKACWDRNPEQRPPMTRLLAYLELCSNQLRAAPSYIVEDFVAEQWIAFDAFPISQEPFVPHRVETYKHTEQLATEVTAPVRRLPVVDNAGNEEVDDGLNNPIFSAPGALSSNDGGPAFPEELFSNHDSSNSLALLSPPTPPGGADSRTRINKSDAEVPNLSFNQRAATSSSVLAPSNRRRLHHFRSHTPNIHQMHHQASLYGRQSSSLDRSQKFSEDVPAFQLSKSETHPIISVDDVLDQVQKVGSAASAEEAVESIKTLLNLSCHSDMTWTAYAGRIRMEVFGLIWRTFSFPSNYGLFSLEEFGVMTSGGPRPADPIRAHNTDAALDVVMLLVENISMRVNTSSDLVTAATILYRHRQYQGYIPMLYLLLEAGKDFVYPYNDIVFLMDMKRRLQVENRPLVNEISAIINSLRCARPA